MVVYLLDAQTNQLDMQVSSASGAYSFSSRPPGVYHVGIDSNSLPVRHGVSPMDQGGDDQVDSDLHPTNMISGLVGMASGQQRMNLDIGVYEVAKTWSLITVFQAYRQKGKIWVEWKTDAELNTVGYHV
ncbi:MAG: SdrD B-like domain-containing protein, partial [Verrucomicrobiota bacterium]